MEKVHQRKLSLVKNMIFGCYLALSTLSSSTLAFVSTTQVSLSSPSSRVSSSSLAVSSSTPIPPTTSSLPAVEFIDPKTGCEVVLLGCFHGTESSAQDVRQAVTSDTDIVVLELCPSRFEDLKEGMEEEKAETASKSKKPWMVAYVEMIQKTIHQRGVATGLAAAVLGGISGMQTVVSRFSPGLEFRTALECAEQYQCEVVLADQDVDETLKQVGRIPQISWDMLRQENRMEEYQKHSTTLNRAVFGPDFAGVVPKETASSMTSDVPAPFVPVQMFQALLRSNAAVQDLVRLTFPPTFLYYCLLQVLLVGSSLTTETAVDEVYQSSLTMAEMLPHYMASLSILTMSYLGFVLPSVRVILTERDVCLSEGIQKACQQAGRNGRVVAVLGLLHVNGVATRMMNAEIETGGESIVVEDEQTVAR